MKARQPYNLFATFFTLLRLFDDIGEGYISVERFREILREIDATITEEELDGIISDVSPTVIPVMLGNLMYFRWMMMALVRSTLTSFVK